MAAVGKSDLAGNANGAAGVGEDGRAAAIEEDVSTAAAVETYHPAEGDGGAGKAPKEMSALMVMLLLKVGLSERLKCKWWLVVTAPAPLPSEPELPPLPTYRGLPELLVAPV